MRRALGHLVALVAGIGLGWAWRGPSAAPAPTIIELARPASAVPPVRAPATPEEPDEECLCGAERALFEAALARARADAYGPALTWPADAGDHDPEVVRDVMAQLAEDCGGTAALAAVDCEEPPCVGVFEMDAADTSIAFRLQTCAAWAERYEGSGAMSFRTVRCGDEDVRLLLFGPPWPEEALPDGVSVDAYQRRLRHRWDVLADSACRE